MKEELDLSAIGFPVLSEPLEEDFPLQLCVCPYCWRSYWVIPRPEYHFRCVCGGMSIFDGLTMREVTAAEYREIKTKEHMKTVALA
jgi:hypothetical protein